MVYLKFYLIALFKISQMLGLIYLISSFLYGFGYAEIFIWLAVTSALGGPMYILMNGNQEQNNDK